MVLAHFQNIRYSLLREIEKATKSLDIAVYWFTNQELFDLLKHKQNNGVSCKLIIHNDYINNRDTGLPFQKFIDAGGEFYFSDESNPMHNKFCIIDNQTLINGSYNWTYYAENKNHENILIIKDEKHVVDAFEKEFQKLIALLSPIKEIKRLTHFEVEDNYNLSHKEYLAHDYVYQAKVLDKPEIATAAFNLVPNNMNVQRIGKELDLVKKYKLKHTVSVSLVNDGVKVVARKGASIPATFINIVRTAVDNQIKSVTDILYGESVEASANTKITTVTMEGLPMKPSGKAEVKFTLFIDINGNLRIEKMSLDNGLKEVFNDKVNWLIEEG